MTLSKEEQALCNLILNHPLNKASLNDLMEQLQRPAGVLPFVGAGLSIPLGLPGWTRFLMDGAEECDLAIEIQAYLDNGEFEEAAEKLYKSLGWMVFERRLDTAFQKSLPKTLSPDLALMRIRELTNGPVITTNFDRALEAAFHTQGSDFTDICWGNTADRLTTALVEDGRVLLKLHGDVLDRQGRILTLSEYQAHYGPGPSIDWERPLPNSLRRVFENRPVLFVGCSLNHDRTLRIAKEITRKTNLPHFAIIEMPSDPIARRAYLSEHGILSIFFPQGRFDAIGPFLSYLAAQRRNVRTEQNSKQGGSQPEPIEKTKSSTGRTRPSNPIRTNPDAGKAADFWANRGWHHHVHEHLHERLSYYLVRIRPYDRALTVAQLDALVKEDELGTVRAYELFGTYDLLIRAWLPGDYDHKFEGRLSAAVQGCEGVQPFSVRQVVERWYRGSRARSPMLSELDEKTIEDLQIGLQPQLLERLYEQRLVFDRITDRVDTITFFVAINFERELTIRGQEDVANRLAEYLTAHKGLCRIAVDRGHGICEFLVKAEAEQYYTIDEVPDWITRTFRADRAITETYLSKAPTHISGGGRIGGSTFAAIQGRDLFVSSIVPEVYPRRTAVHEEVENLIRSRPEFHDLGTGGRRLARDYFSGVLRGDESRWQAVLFQFFKDIEGYLFRNHAAALGRLGKNPKAVYQEVGLGNKPQDQFTLLDLLQICSRGLKGDNRFAGIDQNWHGLTSVRNAITHSRPESSDWGNMFDAILTHWTRLKSLISAIETLTGQDFRGTYRGE